MTNDWDKFVDLLHESDLRFDSGLFDTSNDPFFRSKREHIRLDSDTVRDIVDSIYFPEAPYTFLVFEPEFLGSIYEQFLTERISVGNGNITLTRKPEHVGRDIVATPRPIIERIVQDTIYPSLRQMSLPDILTKKIIDLACGSGGFLISAFDVLMDAVTTAFVQAGNYNEIYEVTNGWQLTFEAKCKLLTNCIYGVDRDYAATEVTKFSLLVKLLEDESSTSLPHSNSILPRLDQNIVFGDSLVDERIYLDDLSPVTNGPPLTWGREIPQMFDYIIGNPPYMKTEDMINLENTEHQYYKKYYATAYRQFDKYYLFLERAIKRLLAEDGYLTMVISRKFLHIESGKRLRGLLSRDGYITHLIDFGNAQLFEGRTTYTCIISLRGNDKLRSGQDEPVHYEVVTTLKDWVNQGRSTSNFMKLPRYLINTEEAWLLPGNDQELKLIEALYADSSPLGDVADVFNGIQTSANDVYVINNWIEVDAHTISFNRQGQDWLLEKDIVKPLFDEVQGTLISFYPLPMTAYVIFPYVIDASNTGFQVTLIPPTTMQSNYPLAYAWLLHNRMRLESRDIQPRPFPPEEWYRYGRNQALALFENRPKIVVGVNSQGDKYVYDDSNTLLATGGTAGECAIAAFRETPEKSPYDLYFILALLNHKAIEYFCRKRGSPFRGGWYARGTSVLKQIPIPQIDLTVDTQKRRIYENIVLKCKRLCDICASMVTTTTNAERVKLERSKAYLKQSMDAEVSALYGISEIIDRIELPS